MTSSTVDLTFKTGILEDYIYITAYANRVDGDSLFARCNFCGADEDEDAENSAVFYRGSDTSMPESDWLTRVFIHLSEKHPNVFDRTGV